MDVDPAFPTARFRQQHISLLEHARTLREWRSPEDVRAHAAEIVRRVARFVGALKVHAAMEEQALYPSLLRHADATVAAAARRILDDVGPIYAAVESWAGRWGGRDHVEKAPAEFLEETRSVLRTLGERVARETVELYPLVDAAGTAPRSGESPAGG